MVVVCFLAVAPVWATPDFVEHVATNQVYGESAGVTMREPDIPCEDDAVDIWLRIGYSFYYDHVAIYYTTDGTEPTGSFGIPSGTSAALVGASGIDDITFVRNEPHSPNNIDWWKTTLPFWTRAYGTTVKYKISAWDSGGGHEVFANNYGCADGTCDDPGAPATTFEYTVKLAWPGKGSPHADHNVGYPDVHFWKEEGVVGNNYINVMVDQNGSVYDVYYPSAGCVQGMGTKNEGYVDGLDTFPPGLPAGYRGQMNINQAMAGLRVDGVTYWVSNEAGGDYTDHTQSYIAGTNVIETSQRLVAGGNNILVRQCDYAPKGISFPLDDGANPNRGLYIKRMVLTNNGASSKTVGVYFFADFALNGGDDYDAMFTDAARGAMVAYDNTQRTLPPGSAEYNPTSGMDYNKNVSVYLGAAMRLSDAVGGSSGTPATGFWSDTSSDQGLGWIGMQVELPAGASKEVAVLLVGGFDNFAGANGTYDYQMDNAIDWFLSSNLQAIQTATETYWTDWLADGVTVDTPDKDYDTLFKRGLLGTALHLDGQNGGIIAGMHNGAYPFVWPRDAGWAAITLDRAGHTYEAEEIYRFLREVTERYVEGGGRVSWWYQKYTTDGKRIWTSPQVDETSVFPWGVYYHYNVVGDIQFLDDNYATVYEAARASSEDSDDSRLHYDNTYQLMHSNNLWEDSWDLFLYSNASVERCLRDAVEIANILDQNVCPGGPGTCLYDEDAAMFTSRADNIHSGMDGRLAWDGENTDISQLGLAYPFDVYHTTDPAIEHMVNRMNGVATDTYGNNHPLVNFGGEWDGLINRYWGDTYWNGGPWFLTTLWYGCYYAQRQDFNPDKADIDNHKYRLDLLIDRLGPIGLGAEQIAPANSLMYPGETDFLLQAAWPNAWESMSFLVDAVMMFLDYTPDAANNTLRIEPKLPTAWSSMTFNNVKLGSHRINVACTESATVNTHTFTNVTGNAVDVETVIRVPAGTTVFGAARNGQIVSASYDSSTGRVTYNGSLETGSSAATAVAVHYGTYGDGDGDGDIDLVDYALFVPCMTAPGSGSVTPPCLVFDFDTDGDVDLEDFASFQAAF
ncbi:MAG: hypothetical protein KAV82_08065 [Phycisphaerae bacterium]|nr:hypothetical protein [Phycisphaerae bacterium]